MASGQAHNPPTTNRYEFLTVLIGKPVTPETRLDMVSLPCFMLHMLRVYHIAFSNDLTHRKFL